MNRIWTIALALLFLSLPTLVSAKEPAKGKQHKITKLYFLFHPVCWRMHGATPPKGADPENWKACYERELRVNELQKKFMSKMKSNEALIVFPIGTGKAMRDLEQHAEKVLGKRAIIVRRGGKDPPRAWAKFKDPIQRFLSSKPLKGRKEFLSAVPKDIQNELANELRSATKGGLQRPWNVSVLEVAYYSRMCAMDILQEFKKRGLYFDPKTTKSVAFGEGFEQCAMTWKQMLVPYMGLSHPAENRFDLSVSGAPWLVNAKLVERVKLSHDLRLFLWRGKKGQLIAMYARAWCRLQDPQLYVRIPLGNLNLVVKEVHDKQCWPKPDAPELKLKVEKGKLRVPIFNGIRRDFDWRKAVLTDEEACYLIARDISLKDFRERLVKAKISAK